MESTDCVVKLRDSDMYVAYTVSFDFNTTTLANWQKHSHKLTDNVTILLSECTHRYTVLDSYEIEFESVEDAVRFKLLYHS